MVDLMRLERIAVRRGGSSPSMGTKIYWELAQLAEQLVLVQ